MMKTEEITIRVEAGAAQAYRSAVPEARRKMELLFNLWLKEAATTPLTLSEVMDRASQEAQSKGLTPELLAELLNE